MFNIIASISHSDLISSCQSFNFDNIHNTNNFGCFDFLNNANEVTVFPVPYSTHVHKQST